MMILQDLLDELFSLPMSARTAHVVVSNDVDDLDVISVRYEHGVVDLICEEVSEEEKIDHDTD